MPLGAAQMAYHCFLRNDRNIVAYCRGYKLGSFLERKIYSKVKENEWRHASGEVFVVFWPCVKFTIITQTTHIKQLVIVIPPNYLDQLIYAN